MSSETIQSPPVAPSVPANLAVSWANIDGTLEGPVFTLTDYHGALGLAGLWSSGDYTPNIAKLAAVNNSITSLVTQDHFCQVNISGNKVSCALTISDNFGVWSAQPIILAANAHLTSLTIGANCGFFRTGYSVAMDISGNDDLVVSQAAIDKILENLAANYGESGGAYLHYCNVVLTGPHVSEPSATGWGHYDAIWQNLYGAGDGANYSTLVLMGARPVFPRQIASITNAGDGYITVRATVRWIGYQQGGYVTFSGLDPAWAALESGSHYIAYTGWDESGEHLTILFDAEGLDPCTSGTVTQAEA